MSTTDSPVLELPPHKSDGLCIHPWPARPLFAIPVQRTASVGKMGAASLHNISHALIKSFDATLNSVVACYGGDFSFKGISYLVYLNEIAVELAECLGQVLLGEI